MVFSYHIINEPLKFGPPPYFVILLIVVSQISSKELYSFEDVENVGQNDVISRETMAAYGLGINMGIIKQEKYSRASFRRDEDDFKNLYKEYISLNASRPINYEEWLVMNNFGILPDTQESLFKVKATKRSTADNKRLFVKSVKKGDILISRAGEGGLMGHAAIMTSDYWVLDMPGGPGWARGIKDNNRQLGKDEWYEEYSSNWITVYRCPDNKVARAAAEWADYNYYNPNGGSEKTKHIKYLITTDLYSTCPSYSSKLVLQAFYFGPKKKVVKELSSIEEMFIAPTKIPSYFRAKYKPINKGKF